MVFTTLLTINGGLVKKNLSQTMCQLVSIIFKYSDYRVSPPVHSKPQESSFVFFYLSKVIGFFLLPSNLLCCVLLLGLWLGRTRFYRGGRKIVSLSIIILLATGLSPLGNWLLLPLEGRFVPPREDKRVEAPHGIIILGGAVDTIVTKARRTAAVNNAGERLIEAAILAKRFPEARILFSGGSGRIFYERMSEADVVRRLFSQMGIHADRLLFENKSKNTWQNAIYTREILHKDSHKKWLLVTSAYHMPRAIGCFRKAGINVIPWPVDFRTRGIRDIYRVFNRASEGWRRVDIATREWIGLAVYRITGRINEIFPVPQV